MASNDQFLDHDWPSREWIEFHRVPFMIIKGQLLFRFPNNSLYNQSKSEMKSTMDAIEEIENSNENSEWDLYKE